MGRRQDHQQHLQDATMVNYSSIALLQERFRQLEKVKERREGKELLKLFSSSSDSSSSSSPSAMHFQASSQQPSLVHGSLSLGLSQPSKEGRHHEQAASTSNFEHSDVDVDTSLHL
ncbi:uncharacterized protein LOC114758218 [Neltuma alba]|uniref:uncharacterized protein LOC114758218 n=1 Tax=Neltuma alba TaxID=207710 RepID=UPI0010A31428|nr:uncharacterized protein LOC114758218 [Prosopis alba]